MIDSFPGAKPAIDLFGMATSPTKRTNDKPEAAALVEVLKALRAHPAVVWCERMNSGAAKVGGRLLGVEVKSPTGKLRPEQTIFLDRIRGAGGVAFMARDCRDVFNALGPL